MYDAKVNNIKLQILIKTNYTCICERFYFEHKYYSYLKTKKNKYNSIDTLI